MKGIWQSLIRVWINWAAPVMLVAFMAVSIFLAFQQHAAFQTSLYDLGSYTQVVWNISRGAGFTTSLGPTNYLTNHFSLLLLLIAPLFSIWPDARTLMVVQSIALTVTIIPGYLILRNRYPRLAPLLVLAFVFSPLLHQTVAAEFHGVMLAAPFLAWAFYALYRRRTRMLFLALGLALLAREDVGLYVASFGLFILVCRSGQRLIGLALTALGGLWVVVVIGWVMPSLGHVYHHFVAFSALGGDSIPDMVSNVLHDPLRLVSTLLTTSKLKAFVRLIAPLAGLPLITPGYILLWLPITLVYLISNASGSGLLNSWRVAPFLPLLWGPIAALLVRLRLRWALSGLAVLLLATLVGFFTLSPFPGGGRFDPAIYQVSAHTQLGEQLVASIPPQASLAAQNGLAAHLATRSQLRLFPWYNHAEPPELFVLDEKATNRYPLSADALKSALVNLQIDPAYEIVREQDGYFVFRLSNGPPPLFQAVSLTWSSMLRLDGFDLAQSSQSGPFEPVSAGVEGESILRVHLYWTALQPMSGYYAISVRLLAPDGSVLAQDDSWPARGTLPTPLWAAGRSIRDPHYLDLSKRTLPRQLTLKVIVYAADTLQPVEPALGSVLATLPVR